MNAEVTRSETLLVAAGEAARMLGISKRNLWSLTKRGEIACVRIGRRVLYYVRTLREWIERREAANGKRQ